MQRLAGRQAPEPGVGGDGGDFGLGTGARGPQLGALDILSDTQGVDFGPYLQRILQDVRENWYHLIPESAEMKKGKLAIEFAITSDGKVARHATRRHFGRCCLGTLPPGQHHGLESLARCLAISPDLTWRCVSGFITTPTKPIWNKLSELRLPPTDPWF